MTGWLKPYTLTGTEIWDLEEWGRSREKDIQQELPKGQPSQTVPQAQPGMVNGQLLRFILVVLLALYVSKRL